VTVCIAAICEAEDPKIVLCTDLMASSPLGNKLVVKDYPLTKNWHCLTAGTDDEINALIPKLIRRLGMQPIDETNIVPLIRAVLKERKIEKSDEITLAKWGMSYEEFRRDRSQFPEDQYRIDMGEIARIPLDAECILAGFETISAPTLLQIDDAWGVKIREDFAVAGEGAYLAQSVMLHRSQVNHYTMTQTLPQSLYCVYEAKRYAERVASVGKDTWLAVCDRDGGQQIVSTDGLAFLEEQFKKYGPRELGPITFNQDFFTQF
jgi:hypothetical protein